MKDGEVVEDWRVGIMEDGASVGFIKELWGGRERISDRRRWRWEYRWRCFIM